MLFLLGLAIGLVGFAMMVVGKFRWLGAVHIPSRTSRIAGGIFLSFFPLYLGIREIIKFFELDERFQMAPAYWVLVVVCILSAIIVLFRGAVDPNARTSRRDAGKTPAFLEEPTAAATDEPGTPAPGPSDFAPPSPPAPARGKRRPAENNPFDFS